MKATPQITADFEEYPELGKVIEAALRRVIELMEVHDIIELRRIRKTGVFGHPYAKDVVTPMGIPYVPSTVAAARYSAGKALLDYLETIGVGGITLEVTEEDVMALAALWSGKKPAEKKPETKSLDPEPVDEKVPDTTPETPLKDPLPPPKGEDETVAAPADPMTPFDASGKPAEPLMKKQEG